MIKKSALFAVIFILNISMYGCSSKQQTTAEKQSTVEKQATAENQATAKKQATAEKQSTVEKQATVENQTTAEKQATTNQNNKATNSTDSKNKTVVKEMFYGNWIVKDNPVSGSVSSSSSEDVKNIVGQKLNYSEGQASYGNNICTSPVYKKSNISETDFESNNRVNIKKLNLAGFPIKRIDVDGLSGMGSTFYVKDANTLLVYEGGFYFELIRVN